MFDKNIKFKYTWRPYQEKVLKDVQKYLADGKVNIVAAPGSGKTVLGLELARSLGRPVIIFAPTVTIKNQWVERFVSLFTDFEEIPEWISTNIYDLKFFNVVTYQALHYAYKKQKIRNQKDDDTDEEVNQEEVIEELEKIKSYDLIQEIKKNNISTIVLDEAHHLKSEWWKSLTDVISSLNNVKLISLTATPPYDADLGTWQKYIGLCGEIDAEISVPELVAVNNLCPHQDYIYFNYPTKKELEEISNYQVKLKEILSNLQKNRNFMEAIKNHPYIKDPYQYETEILENVEYYSSMIIFLNSCSISINKENKEILGHKSSIPKLTMDWLEILLKNVILSDRKNYQSYESEIENIEKELKKLGVIEKKTLSFSENKTLEKYFVNSIGKLESISEIVNIEYNSLKENLRMVILTDFIRKEYLESNDMEINKMGVFPIFISLLEKNSEINLAVLTGSIFIIPKKLQEKLLNLCKDEGIDGRKVRFKELSISEKYVEVEVSDSVKNKVMSLISKIFSEGEIQIIIGTKSLLGEGWDEPSINSLILASFVGSYMLSNQMRGRAIRVNKNPRKTANVWHLVCVTDELDKEDEIKNADYEMLKRRFEAFAGIGYESNLVENGLERLKINPPFTEDKVKTLNEKTKSYSIKREEMYDRWKNCIENIDVKNTKMIEQIEVPNEQKMKKTWFVDAKFIIFCIVTIMILLGLIFGFFKSKFLFIIVELILGIYLLTKIVKIKRLSSSEGNLRELAKVVLDSLYRCKFIKTGKSRIKIVVKKENKKGKIICYLTGTTMQENNLFLDSLKEVLEKTVNQRYIIVRLNRKLEDSGDYYNVPTVLSQNKEMAEVFYTFFKAKIGKCDLVYTKNAEGRRMLLKVRASSLSLKDRITRKQVYSNWK